MNRSARTARRVGRAAAVVAAASLSAVGWAAPAPASTPATKPAPATQPASPAKPGTAAKPGPAAKPSPAAAPARPAPAANEPLPTQADIRAAFDAQDYPGVLQKIQRVLILRGKAAEPYDRHALLVLKAEAHLAMRAGGPAAQAFAEAGKIAADGPAAATDIAAEMLVRRSGAGLAYQPKLKDPADKTKAQPAIDIVDPDGRKRALAALFADEWAAVEPRVRAAGRGATLAPLMAALPDIRNLRWVEMAATGADDKSRELVGGLVARAKTVIGATVKELAESVDSVELTALQVTTARVPRYDKGTGKILGFDVKYKRVGPTPRQFATLRDALATATKVRDNCDELGGSLGATGREFDETKAKAEQLRLKAGTLLDTDWTAKSDQPPKPPTPPK